MISVYTHRAEAIIRYPEVPDVLANTYDRLMLQRVHRPLHGLGVLALHALYAGGESEKPGQAVLDFLTCASAFIGGNRSLEDMATEGFQPGAHTYIRDFQQEPHMGQNAAHKGVVFVAGHPITDMTVHYQTRREPEFQTMPVAAVAASFGIGGHGDIASAHVRLSASAAGTPADPAYELRALMGYTTHEGIPLPEAPTFEMLALAGEKLGAFPMQH